jgi:hypothetical protein
MAGDPGTGGIDCPACGEPNPGRARFCLACGDPLPAAAPRPGGARKAVTVVFSDLTGSTALAERLDPESLTRVMARYYEAMRAQVRHHGGTVEKFAGDAVMAVSGIPAAHEDDALRAVRAAADMHAALGRLNAELGPELGVQITRVFDEANEEAGRTPVDPELIATLTEALALAAGDPRPWGSAY